MRNDEKYDLLVESIEKAIEETGKKCKYIITEDMLGFGEHEELLVNNNYIIRQFGDYYVAFIF